MSTATLIRSIGALSSGLVVALLMVGVLALPARAFAADDAPVPPSASSFQWVVQLPDGMSIGGVSIDLPDAIRLAELRRAFSDQDIAIIVATLTDQATAAGVSLGAAAQVATPAPIAAQMAQDSAE